MMSKDGIPQEPLLSTDLTHTAGGVAHQESLSSQSRDPVDSNIMESQLLSVSYDHDTNAKYNNKHGNKKGAYLSFDNIKLSIADKNKDKTISNGDNSTGSDHNLKRKYILNGISGEAFPNQLLGIIGASGGGKTTLLSLISGRFFKIDSLASNAQASGEIYLNKSRVDCSKNRGLEYLSKSIGFVLQEDLLFETETAGEAINVSAQLRLNNKINGRLLTKDEKEERAYKVIEQLDLWNSRNTKIGGQTIRGLSGGERKRVSIGIELVTDPNIVLLDEPTSGLDSAIAFQTMQLLKNLANQGKTVVASLHQPSSEIFGLLDRVMILAKGRVIYNGYVNDLALYLKDNTGYECPQYSNIADFVLQQVHEQPEYFISKWDEYTVNSNETSFIPNNIEPDSQLKQQLSVSKLYRKSSGDFTYQVQKAKMAPICTQISILLKRQFAIFIRNPVPTYVRNAQALFTAILQGGLWWQLKKINDFNENSGDYPNNVNANIYNRFGGIFYAVTFAAMNAVMAANLTFPSQRAVFQKERASNWYYTAPFLFGKTLLDLPLAWLVMLPFSIIIYYMCAFRTVWYKIYLILGLVASVADSMGFFIGCVASRPEVAIQLTPLTIIPLFLFSGFFISIDSIPIWISWVKWIDCFYYATEIFCIEEFAHINGHTETGTPGWYAHEFLKAKDLNVDNKMRDIYACIILMVAVRALAIAFLMYKNGR